MDRLTLSPDKVSPAVRDAVETFLALDARTAARPIIADPAEASLVRVVTRLFARRGGLRVELIRSAASFGEPTSIGVGTPFRRPQ